MTPFLNKHQSAAEIFARRTDGRTVIDSTEQLDCVRPVPARRDTLSFDRQRRPTAVSHAGGQAADPPEGTTSPAVVSDPNDRPVLGNQLDVRV